MIERILKNTAYLFTAQAVTKVISFFYTIFLARSLGVADFGLYSVALAYFSLLSVASDFGINRYLIREGSKNPKDLPKFVSNSLILRTIIGVSLFLLFSISLYLLDPDFNRVKLSILAALAVIPQTIALTLDAALVAKEKLKFSAISLLGLSILTTLFGILFIGQGFSSLGAVSALILGEIIYAIILYFFLKKDLNSLNLNFNLDELIKVVKGSFPYAILGVLGLLYFKIDTLLLGYLKGAEEAGYYSAAYRFLEAAIFIPSSLATALFPVISRLHDTNTKEIKRLYFLSLKLLGGISIILFLGFVFILPNIISWLLPNYLPSIQAILILSFAIPFIFLHVPGALILLATDKYFKIIIYLSLITLSFNIFLNIILISQLGFIGAAYASVASEAFSLLVFFTLLYFKILRYA